MRLITPYAPPTFLKPCLIVSTYTIRKIKETAIAFVSALNPNHSLGMFFEINGYEQLGWERKCSDWIIIKKYKNEKQAINNHLNLVKNFINGDGDIQWQKGWGDYLKLYEKYCPKKFKDN